MSDAAVELREAAQHMRDHHPPSHARHVFWAEIADWLEGTAKIRDRHRDAPQPAGFVPRQDRIARAYMASITQERS